MNLKKLEEIIKKLPKPIRIIIAFILGLIGVTAIGLGKS